MAKQKLEATPRPWGQEYDGCIVIGGQVIIGPSGFKPDSSTTAVGRENCRLAVKAVNLHDDLILAGKWLLASAERCPEMQDAPGIAEMREALHKDEEK